MKKKHNGPFSSGGLLVSLGKSSNPEFIPVCGVSCVSFSTWSHLLNLSKKIGRKYYIRLFLIFLVLISFYKLACENPWGKGEKIREGRERGRACR